jgi:glycosyltransferase involved in cell wall biosynthesis
MNMAQYAARLERVKKIVMPHDAEDLIYRQILDDASGILERIRAWLWWKKVYSYEKRIYPLFDTCIVVSERDKKALLEVSDRIKAEVLPSGVDTSFFRPPLEKAQNDILIFTGVMNTWSNIDAVIFFVKNILPLVEKNNPSVRFYIAGKRPSPEVKELACKNIIVTGEVPDIRQYLEDAAIFVAPFRIGTGLKHKILEAMAMGIPVVSTTLGANGIEVKSGENIILADTPDEFARGVIGLLCDARLREKIVRNAGVLVREKYNWDSIGQVMENILQRVLRS